MRPRIGLLIASFARSAPALRNGSLLRVTVAYLVYRTVELAAWAAILIYAYEATGPASVGLVVVSQLVPSAIAAPFLAGLGDRYEPERALVGWLLVQAGAIATTGFAILVGAPAIVVYILSAAATIVLTQTRPIQAALLPRLADTPEELTGANALQSVSDGIGGFAGPLAVGIVAAVASIGTAFVAAGCLLVAGAIPLLGVRAASHRRRPPRTGAVRSPERARTGLNGDAAAVAAPGSAAPRMLPAAILSGLRATARDRDTFTLMVLLTGRMVVYGGLEVLVVLLALDLLGTGQSGAAGLLAAVGVGAILGGLAAFALLGRRRLAPWLGVGAVAIGLPVALVGYAPGAAPAGLLLGICGVGLATLDVAGGTLLQRITPDGLRARVFGLLEGLLLLGEAAGSLLIGPFAVIVGVPVAAVVLGVALPAVALLALGRFEGIDRRAIVPVAELDALRQVPMFMPLGPAALEAAARHLTPFAASAGTRVIRQGDPGDRWYLVRDGRLSVSVDGRELDVLGTGDGFGEIALLHDVPRTASVTALTDVSLWVLERQEFLAAVTGAPSAYAEAERLAAERIAAQVPAAARAG